MNGLVFLLPFLLVVVAGQVNNSFAAQDDVIVGEYFTDVKNPDGTRTWSSHYQYFFDGENYVPYAVNNLNVQSAIANVTLNNDGSYDWNGKFNDRIVAKYADVTDLTSWTYPNVLNNAVPSLSFSNGVFHSNKTAVGVGTMDYRYIFDDGKWKTELEVTNLSALTTKVFGFDQIIELESDTIKFGGVTRNLDNFHDQTFDKTFLDNNSGDVLDLLNGIKFDFDLGYQFLHSVYIEDTGPNSSRLTFDFRGVNPLLPATTLIIDPTFGPSAGTAYSAQTVSGTGTSCPSWTGAITSANNFVQLGGSGFSQPCKVASFEFDITSMSAATSVTNTELTYDIATATSWNKACHFMSMENAPSSYSTSANLKDDIINGTNFGNSTDCQTNGAGYTINLGSAANDDVLANVGDGWWGVGIWDNALVRDATNRFTDFTLGELTITYGTAPIPDAVDDLTYTNLTGSSLDLLWTEPGLNGGNVTNYMVNSTTPWSSTTSFLANTTNTYYNVTGLTWGTDYSFSASVLTEGGYNFTGNILNITTPAITYSGVAPTGLTVNDCFHTCSTQLNLEWAAGLMDNINGFRIFFETPIGNGFTTLTANTTNTNTYYNHTSLTAGTFYNYKVAALNSTGISENSTAYAYSPHKLPDAVTDLVVTPNSFLQFEGAWSAPTLYGTLSGYQVNYTTPAGDPTTIYTSTNIPTSITISGLDPTTEHSFRVAAITSHGTNATGNIYNSTNTVEIEVGDLEFEVEENPNAMEIWYELFNVDSTTDNVQVRFDSALTVDCTVSHRIAGSSANYTSLAETSAGSYVYHNFTVTNAGNDILDWDCWDQTDPTINGQYSLTQAFASSGAGGFGNIPMFSQMANFSDGLYGTEGDFAGIDLITMIIVIISMIGFNRTHPALGVGVMTTLLGAAYYFELIPWTSGVLGGAALVVVLAIGMGLKKRD